MIEPSQWDGTLRVDIETFCEADLGEVGVYKYVAHPSFEVTLFGCQENTAAAVCFDLTRGPDNQEPAPLPERIIAQLYNPRILKLAWNAGFEVAAISEYLVRLGRPPLDVTQWRCTMTRAMMVGLPAKLSEANKAAHLAEEDRKDSAGRALVRYFCMPCKPTRTNGGRARNLPHHEPEKWRDFVDYCRQDVVAEGAMDAVLLQFPVDDREWNRWHDDIRINRRGVAVDRRLVRNAIALSEQEAERDLKRLAEITGVSNPSSVSQLKDWLEATDGEEVKSLTKKNMPEILANTTNEAVKEAIELRQRTSKSSVKKYLAMERAAGDDDRVRGLLQFYGANRTGRESGRLVQVQNLKSNTMQFLDHARQLLLDGQFEALKAIFGDPQETLAQLVRTAFVPEAGSLLLSYDFSAIEARVLAWLANETWRLEVFRTHGRIYEASAARMFRIDWAEFQEYIDQGKKHPLRKKGKVSELALGFQGGPGAMLTMGALEEGLTEEELPGIVKKWRAESPRIVRFWYAVQDAAFEAVQYNRTTSVKVGPEEEHCFIRFQMIQHGGRRALYCWLPSGRPLVYWNAHIAAKKRKSHTGEITETESIFYEGYTKRGPWGLNDTYGGKLVENITQGVARDLLFGVLDDFSDEVVFHVHDELVSEVPAPNVAAVREQLDAAMSRTPLWAPGLPLSGEGVELAYYMKTE